MKEKPETETTDVRRLIVDTTNYFKFNKNNASNTVYLFQRNLSKDYLKFSNLLLDVSLSSKTKSGLYIH